MSKPVFAFVYAAVGAFACHPKSDSPASLSYEAINGTVETVEHDGRRAIHLVAPPETRAQDVHLLAIATGSTLRDGRIQIDVAGSPVAGAPADARGFIGLAFHVEPHGSRFECFYVRPTNGRADDQLRRNHSTQYVSYPDFPWEELRQASPGVYESYADIQAGVWTSLEIVVEGKRAKLFVNHAEQPVLIVNDLELGEGG